VTHKNITNLPAGLRQMDIGCEQFKRLLKTDMFKRWDRGAAHCDV